MSEIREYILKNDTFPAWKYFPIDWDGALEWAKVRGKKYIDFNGAIFKTDVSTLDYSNKLCWREDLINDIWFISDTHFGQKRTLDLSKRPFKNVDEMDDYMINQWNSLIQKDDLVFHLGDFGDYKISEKLNGKIILLSGNYERNDNLNTLYSFSEILVDDVFTIKINDQIINMCHEPLKVKEISNGINLFGHIHGLQKVKPYGLNVGVDSHHFRPINYKTVLFYENAIKNFYDDNVFL